MKRMIFGAVVAIGLSVAMSHVVMAAPPLPGGESYDAIQGWCNENGGFFWADDTSLTTYGCIFDDGTLVICHNLGVGPHGETAFSCSVSHVTPFLPGVHPRTVQELVEQQKQVLIAEQGAASTLSTIATQVASILAGQSQILREVNGFQQACTTPDLLPLPITGVAGPTGFCRLGADGNLQVQVYNQGGAVADASVTRVTFTTTTGPLPIDVPTSPLGAFGGSELVEFTIPANCTGNTGCEFSIGVDATNLVSESNEGNNTAAGTCIPKIF
jgi:hypothetical protein